MPAVLKDHFQNPASVPFLECTLFRQLRAVRILAMYLLLSAAGGKDKDMYFNQVEFGQRIKEERNRLGLTQEELAEQLNIGPVHVYNIESGRKGCSIDLLLEFAELFEVSTDYLLTGKGNMNAEIREHLQGAIDELEGLLQGISRK